jgi:hypothetical protein
MKLTEILGNNDSIEMMSAVIKKAVKPLDMRVRWLGELPTIWMTLTPETSAKVAYHAHPEHVDGDWYVTINDIESKSQLASATGNEDDVLALLMKHGSYEDR